MVRFAALLVAFILAGCISTTVDSRIEPPTQPAAATVDRQEATVVLSPPSAGIGIDNGFFIVNGTEAVFSFVEPGKRDLRVTAHWNTTQPTLERLTLSGGETDSRFFWREAAGVSPLVLDVPVSLLDVPQAATFTIRVDPGSRSSPGAGVLPQDVHLVVEQIPVTSSGA